MGPGGVQNQAGQILLDFKAQEFSSWAPRSVLQAPWDGLWAPPGRRPDPSGTEEETALALGFLN